MPNQVTADGLETATQSELVSQYTAAFETIYGADIDLDPETPDGQMMMIFIQSVLDVEDLITQVYNMFDPDNAIGVVLDQRVAINGIQRQAGTFSVTNVTIATNQSVNLYGLDQDVQPVFTISDSAGNQYELQVTQLGFNPGSGGASLAFQASNPGAIIPIPNTITAPVTVVLGVTTINNPSTYTTLGINEETDAALKVRRQKSVSLSSQGYYAGLLAALENIPGMSFAAVNENDTNTTDIDGVPGHSIWVITAGDAAPSAIAQAIYSKRNAGCGMFGSQSYAITQVDGTICVVNWDDVVQENLFIRFNVTSINGVSIPLISAIVMGLSTPGDVGALVPSVNQEVNINELATLVQEIDPNSLVTVSGFDIAAGGSFANNILSPSARNKQFAVLASNIIVLPMILQAANGQLIINNMDIVVSTATIANGGNTIQFSELGGYTGGSITYSMVSGGGSVNASTGLYTSGVAGTDVVQVADSLGHSAICTVTVN